MHGILNKFNAFYSKWIEDLFFHTRFSRLPLDYLIVVGISWESHKNSNCCNKYSHSLNTLNYGWWSGPSSVIAVCHAPSMKSMLAIIYGPFPRSPGSRRPPVRDAHVRHVWKRALKALNHREMNTKKWKRRRGWKESWWEGGSHCPTLGMVWRKMWHFLLVISIPSMESFH